ncbi:MAG TPA: DUF2330 domain-containing protein [Puia sp.]|nr:DUF2330 domain-containing protein [Puia sp.]
MPSKIATPDPRWFQIIFQFFFLIYGIFFLGWNEAWWHDAITIAGCLFFNYAAARLSVSRSRRPAPVPAESLGSSNPTSVQQDRLSRAPALPLPAFSSWGLSALISALGLCLLLRTNHWYTSLFAAFLTVASKYLFRVNNKHIFNPSAFGIAATLLLTGDAWLSPGQWGNNAVLFFLIITLGTIVVTRVQKLDTSLAFLLCFVGLLYWRQVLFLGWPVDYFIHSISTGSLLLFSFFMISDPKTSPNHPVARVIWAILIASAAFYLAAFQWKYNTPVWMLVAAAPLVPLFDKIFKARPFEWSSSFIHLKTLFHFKKSAMNAFTKKITASIFLVAMISHDTMAFCGFYVSKADGTLKNKTSQVILVRDGNRNTITMYNDFKGNFKDFAMVVPVPVVLKKSDIKVVDQQIFKTLNDYSQPRLVEYWDENPCAMREMEKSLSGRAAGVALNDVVVMGYGAAKRKLGVTVEAKYLVGEYDILILSAKESSGLRTWLTENGYKIPAGAEEVLEPYIKSNLKFFVVKVNENEKKKLAGDFLRPIQISFQSPKFMLPIRLGMANADGDQDMIVYAFTKKGRIECTNYRNVSLPTGKNVPLFVQNNFSGFYSNLFQHQWDKEGRSVAMLEYAWDVSPSQSLKCDPCVATAPSRQDLVQAGVKWLSRDWNDYSDVEDDATDISDHVHFTRLHIRYNRNAFPQDLQFEETANTENFQARYVITHPATGDLSCGGGQKYLHHLKERRKEELEMLTLLTGKGYTDWDQVAMSDEEKRVPADSSYRAVASEIGKGRGDRSSLLFATLGLAGLLSIAGLRGSSVIGLRRRRKGC